MVCACCILILLVFHVSHPFAPMRPLLLLHRPVRRGRIQNTGITAKWWCWQWSVCNEMMRQWWMTCLTSEGGHPHVLQNDKQRPGSEMMCQGWRGHKGCLECIVWRGPWWRGSADEALSPHMVHYAWCFSRHRQHVVGSRPREYPPCNGKCSKVQGLISLEVLIIMEGGLLPPCKPKMMCGLNMVCVNVVWLDKHGGNKYEQRVPHGIEMFTLVLSLYYRWLQIKQFKISMPFWWFVVLRTRLSAWVSSTMNNFKALRTFVCLRVIRMLTGSSEKCFASGSEW